jgi:hypothetical protein
MASIKLGIRHEKPVVCKANSSSSVDLEEKSGVASKNSKRAKVSARLRGSIGKTVFDLHAFTGLGGYEGVVENGSVPIDYISIITRRTDMMASADTQKTGGSPSNKHEHPNSSDVDGSQKKKRTEANSPLFQNDLTFPSGESDLLEGIWEPDLGQPDEFENFNSEDEIAAVELKERARNMGDEQGGAQGATPWDRFLRLSGPWCYLEDLGADGVRITI